MHVALFNDISLHYDIIDDICVLLYDISTNFCKQIHWYKNTVQGGEFAIEWTGLDPNQAYPLD